MRQVVVPLFKHLQARQAGTRAVMRERLGREPTRREQVALLSDEPVRVVAHDPGWAAYAEAELGRISEALGPFAVRLEHVGSTAVDALAARPIVDLQVSVAALHPADRFVEPLERLGYRFAPDLDRPEDPLFVRPAAGAATHRVHVCAVGSGLEARRLAVRDFLRAKPDEAGAFGELKRRIAEDNGGDRAIYLIEVALRLDAIEREAIAWAARDR
jgi:GrpB-like predicted nucleotidyltransferase (UPF0157 family)